MLPFYGKDREPICGTEWVKEHQFNNAVYTQTMIVTDGRLTCKLTIGTTKKDIREILQLLGLNPK